MGCKDIDTAKEKSTGINCNNAETLINGDLIFPRITKTGKMEYKPCGRQKGEKRAKYPSCRPTPSKRKDPGKGTKWGKTK